MPPLSLTVRTVGAVVPMRLLKPRTALPWWRTSPQLAAAPSGAPSTLTPATTKAAGELARGSTDRPDLAIPDDLSIPDFLKRSVKS